jgi:hypothetical protein
MFRSLLQPVLHFPFDDARIDAVAANNVRSLKTHFIQQPLAPGFKRLWSLAVAFWQAALEDLKASGSRKPRIIH